MSPRQSLAPLAAALTLLAMTTTTAVAAPEPVTPRVAYTDTEIKTPVSAALPDGRTALAWVNDLTSNDSTLGMVRSSGELLPASPQILASGPAAEDLTLLGGGPASSPVLATFQAGATQTATTMRLDGANFGAQHALLGADTKGRFPAVARCPDGSTVFAYQETLVGAPNTYRVRSWRADSVGRDTTGLTSTVASPDSDLAPVVTCDRTNYPILAYAADPDGAATIEGDRLIVAPLDGGAPLLDLETDGGSSYASTPDARIAPDGRLWIVWTESTGGHSTAYVATRQSGSIDPPTISTLATDMEISDLFFDPAGNVHIAVIDPQSLAWTIRTAAPGADSFGAAVQLPGATGAYGRLLTDHPDGKPRLLLTRSSGPNRSYQVQGIPAAGSGNETSPTILTGDSDATFSYLPSGDLFGAAVQHTGPTTARLSEGGLDTGLAPTLDRVDVAPLAVPGVPTALRIDASDPLGLSEFKWIVAGQELSDQDTSVTFPAPGTYEVVARATDRAGNVATLARTVRVVDPDAVLASSPAPAATPAARDNVAPTLLRPSATQGKRGAAARKVVAKFAVDEAVAVDVELIGTFKKGKVKGTLVLKSTRIAVLAPGLPKSVSLGIAKGADKAIVKGKLLVRVTLTDLAGNRTQKSISVKVAKT